MTAPNPETTARVNWLRRARYFLLAAFLGTIAGFAGVYLTGGLQRNERALPNESAFPEGSCVNASLTAKRLMPFSKGEVAAFAPKSAPRRATPIEFKDATGRSVSLSDFKGRVVLINLWATWCVPCRKEMPALDELEQKLGGKDFAVLAINLDQRGGDKPRKFLEEIKVKHLLYYEDPTTNVFQKLKQAGRAPGLPSTILVDRDGCELGFMPGPAEWASEDALALIRAAIAK
jgi:thiol-disulfide isomerase/thioredoxin